jgi:hypothetical protein
MRKLEPKMVAYLDEKLANNGAVADAIRRRDPRALLVPAALACVGIREATGNNDGPMVELIQETIGGHSNEAWCMAFVMTLLAYAELKTSITSPIYASEGCDQVWTKTPAIHRVKVFPLPGAIVIWGHYNSKGQYTGGHTGILVGADEKTFYAVEGNTSGGQDPNGKVVREGGGCYYTYRNRFGNGDMKVRGFLKPFEAAPLVAQTLAVA